MTPAAYYNEIDPFAAQWLRNLIAGGHIAPGEVDERSIEDVTPDDLRGFTQCHFFAGIGVWSHSLRLAGWPDDRPVWTGSCPCQPFSAAGKGDGFADERHLWPAFHHLISELRPQHVFGEQVAAGNANAWFDLVQADVEGLGYAFGLVPFTSAGIGAPHIRERAYWVANADSVISDRRGNVRAPGRDEYSNGGDDVRLADATGQLHHQCNDGANERGRQGHSEQNRMGGGISWLAVPESDRCPERIKNAGGSEERSREARLEQRIGRDGSCVRPLEVNGFWRDADWLFCRDGKWRPVEPGTFPLVNGTSSRLVRKQPSVAGLARMASRNRTGRLKGYGNAINAQAAAAFIRAYMEVV
ncbi:DNA cytosine methyltransferase [Raoultella terrigena]|uniref:DNA cytosine methyltransferase n=1 Tax=Raoultella terrigena TaxID=577 RepID=UPI000978BC84|nr:DNA cytosine methyltransferase [Raoultella terrigena]OMP92728.1 DNA cytosine methyltransferase [Raoultella terrigena]